MTEILASLVVILLLGGGWFLWKIYNKSVNETKASTVRNEIEQEEKLMDFPTGDVMSLFTGKTLSPRGIAGIHRILNYLYGQELYDFQFAKKAEEALPFLIEQYPALANLKFDDTEQPAYWAEWLDDRITEFGIDMAIRPIPIDRLKPETNKEAWAKAKAQEKLEKVESL